MKTLLAKSAGFCWGVRRAVEMALENCEIAKLRNRKFSVHSPKRRVYTDGSLIHNSHQTHLLEQSGVHQCTDPAKLAPGSVLLIRAHGISPERRKWLESLPLRLVDATCPDVAKIHDIVTKRAAAGATVLIYGDAGHAEVIGLLGCAGERGRVITSPQDVGPAQPSRQTDAGTAQPSRQADAGGAQPSRQAVVLVSQTTQSPESFAQVAAAVLARFPGAEIIDTICRATKMRQAELAELAAKCDAIVVIGSPESANTQRLAECAAKLAKTVVVDSACGIGAYKFTGVTTVGVTAGASTPDFIINAVVEKLEEIGN